MSQQHDLAQRLQAEFIACVPSVRAYLERTLAASLLASLSLDDVLQEVYLRIRQTRTFEFRGRQQLIAWMRVVAKHIILSRIRRVSCERHFVPTDNSCASLRGLYRSGQLTASGELMRREAANQVTEAVAELSEHYQQVLSLHYEHGMSFHEIARWMVRSSGVVRGLHRTALAKLRLRLMPADQADGVNA